MSTPLIWSALADTLPWMKGTQLVCSHLDPKAPPRSQGAAQVCTHRWTLQALAGQPSVGGGSSLLLPGTVNASVYQGQRLRGRPFAPIVLSQAKRSR